MEFIRIGLRVGVEGCDFLTKVMDLAFSKTFLELSNIMFSIFCVSTLSRCSSTISDALNSLLLTLLVRSLNGSHIWKFGYLSLVITPG